MTFSLARDMRDAMLSFREAAVALADPEWERWLMAGVPTCVQPTKLREADDTDHFYGAWYGGKASEGGHPGLAGSAADQFRAMTPEQAAKAKAAFEDGDHPGWKPGDGPFQPPNSSPASPWPEEPVRHGVTEVHDGTSHGGPAMSFNNDEGKLPDDTDHHMFDAASARLRVGEMPPAGMTTALDKTIASGTVTKAGAVWRAGRTPDDLQVGSTITDQGYPFTTDSLGMAAGYLYANGGSAGDRSLIRYNLPVGYHALPDTMAAGYAMVVLPRDANWIVRSVATVNGVRVVDVNPA